MPVAPKPDDPFKAIVSVNIIVAAMQSEQELHRAIAQARVHFPGWTFPNSVQFVTGKRFELQLALIDDQVLLEKWRLAQLFSHYLNAETNWSGANPKVAELLAQMRSGALNTRDVK